MLCSRVGCTEDETHHPTILDIDSSQNGPIELSTWETRFEWKIIKMVDPVSKI